MKEQLMKYIDETRDEAVKGLQELISMVSSDGRETTAQQAVIRDLEQMGFATE